MTSTMPTTTFPGVEPAVEPEKGEAILESRLPYFADQASAERVNPGRGVLLGLLLGGGMWIGIFTLVSFLKR